MLIASASSYVALEAYSVMNVESDGFDHAGMTGQSGHWPQTQKQFLLTPKSI
jgi:hypothetical protein